MFRFLLLTLVGLTFVFPAQVEAHTADQLPFLTINGVPAKIYPVGSTSLSSLVLPEDASEQLFLPNSSITFQLITDNLPILPEYLPKTKWKWSFGDGENGEGSKVSHSYSKVGTYVVELYSTNLEENTKPQRLDRVAIQVVPSLDYVLPKPLITVNGKQPVNRYAEILEANMQKGVAFSSELSGIGSSPIVSRLWDFGDQESSKERTAIHTYPSLYAYSSILLRLTDSNGIFVDQFVQIQNSAAAPTPPPSPGPVKNSFSPLLLFLGIAVSIGVGLFLYIKQRSRVQAK